MRKIFFGLAMITSKNIVNDLKFPNFIANHSIFGTHKTFDKVFPYIGLKNFKCSINDSTGQIPFIISNGSFSAKIIAQQAVSKKWNPLLWKVIGAPLSMFNVGIDTLNFFLYRRDNRNLQVVFSSDQEEGAWDIATMAMRGISSCQSWHQSRKQHLIGSIIDPCCGIMYLTDGKANKYGVNMLHRSIVRYVVHKTLGACLFLEKLYSQSAKDKYGEDIAPDVNMLFACMLYRRTGLPVIYNNGIIDQASLKDEVCIPEFNLTCGTLPYASYRDSGLQYRPLTSGMLKRFPILAKLKAKLTK